MSLSMRLTPLLLVKGNALTKTKGFTGGKYVGDVVNTARIFNDKQADELTLLDIEASLTGDSPNFKLIEEVVSECFLPISYGGGVRTSEDARRLVDCGVDKVVLNTALISDPRLLGEVASSIGASSTVASIDVMRSSDQYKVRNAPDSTLSQLLRNAQEYGAGELLIQDVIVDGTKSGPNLELARYILSETDLPVIYGGGVSSLDQTKDLWRIGVGAVAAGAWFVFNGPHDAVLISYPTRQKIDAAMSEVESPQD